MRERLQQDVEVSMSLTQILDQALEAPLGVIVTSDDPDGLRRRLYVHLRKAREARKSQYENLVISSGVKRGELLIRIKEEPPNE